MYHFLGSKFHGQAILESLCYRLCVYRVAVAAEGDYLKNRNGVVIKLHSQTGGLRFNLSANGMNISLQQS
jgi:hypothetical protein